MHLNNFLLNDDADWILYTDGQLRLIEKQIDVGIEPFLTLQFTLQLGCSSNSKAIRLGSQIVKSIPLDNIKLLVQ